MTANLDIQTISQRTKERVKDKYKLGKIEDLNAIGVAEVEQHRIRLPTALSLQDFVKVTS